jgi:hypothetical protein
MPAHEAADEGPSFGSWTVSERRRSGPRPPALRTRLAAGVPFREGVGLLRPSDKTNENRAADPAPGGRAFSCLQALMRRVSPLVKENILSCQSRLCWQTVSRDMIALAVRRPSRRTGWTSPAVAYPGMPLPHPVAEPSAAWPPPNPLAQPGPRGAVGLPRRPPHRAHRHRRRNPCSASAPPH